MTAAPDVLVVGAGPAGSIAALVLARAGARVRLVDRARFPRDKLCGDTLNPGALARLDRLGLAAAVRARARPVAGMIVTGPRGARIVGEYEAGLSGAALDRRTLDMLLLEAALRAGVEFDDQVSVRAPMMADDGRRVAGVGIASAARESMLKARVVVGADGRHSRLAFERGLARYAPRPRRWAFGAYYTGVDGLTTCGEMHIRPDGYIGVAPLPDGVANVCVVREVGASFRADGVDVDGIVDAAVARDEMLRPRFTRARRETSVTVLGPLAVDARAAGCPGLLLAGDAAGFVDPMTGDGLSFAIRGAELAAEAALQELETGRPAYEDLAAARRRAFSSKWRINRVLRALVASPTSVRAAARAAAIWPAPIRALIAIAGDVDDARHGEYGGPRPFDKLTADRGDR